MVKNATRLMENDFAQLQNALINWYLLNKRDLPWRGISDPYFIWISEIILQQTRVQQGLAYYLKFTDRFPQVADLAQASEEEVLKLWQGLGYYSRARNMHAAAKQVMQDFDGVFPFSYQKLITLKGVGPYTAAAIASISVNEPVAVVDGNVERVISRLFSVDEIVNTTGGKKRISQLAQKILNEKVAGDHNQAMMELGATVCLPKKANCHQCPLEVHCASAMNGDPLLYPKKQKKMKQRKRYFYYFLVENDHSFYLFKRREGDIWQGLYEPLLIESANDLDDLEVLAAFEKQISVSELSVQHQTFSQKHILSHQVIMAKFWTVKINEDLNLESFVKVDKSKLHDYPVSRLVEMFLEQR